MIFKTLFNGTIVFVLSITGNRLVFRLSDPGRIVTREDTPSQPILLGVTNREDVMTALSITLITLPRNGQLSAIAGQAPLSVVYTPDSDYYGNDAFVFVVSDEEGNSSQQVRVEVVVTPVNDAPVSKDDKLNGPIDQSVSGQLKAEGGSVTQFCQPSPVQWN